MNTDKLNLHELFIGVKSLKENSGNELALGNILWQLRSEIEYLTGILSLDIEGEADLDKLTKTVRLNKDEKNKQRLIKEITEKLDELEANKPSKVDLFENLWRLRELITIVIRLLETSNGKDKYEKG